MRAPALLLALVPLALASNCGGSAFTAGGGSDASTGGSSGSSSGVDASSSSSGGGSDAPACTPDTLDPGCNDCIAAHCEDAWCSCVQDSACATYVGCRLRGNKVTTCISACGCSSTELTAGDRLIMCTTANCATACATTGSSSSSGGGSGSGSSSGASSSSSGGSGSSSGSSGGSSGSSSGVSSSSGSIDSGSGGHSDGGSTCVCSTCTGSTSMCCPDPSSPNCGKCCIGGCNGTCL